MNNEKSIELFSIYFVSETIKNAERTEVVTLRMWIDSSGLKMDSSHLRRGWIEFLERAWETANVDAWNGIGLSYWINVSSETVCPGYSSADCVFKSSACSHNLFMSQRMLLPKCSRWMSKWGFGGARRRGRERVQVQKRVKVFPRTSINKQIFIFLLLFMRLSQSDFSSLDNAVRIAVLCIAYR